MSAAGSADAGISLIETLVAVTLIGLVALIGFPRLQQSLTAFSQRAAASEIAARLRQARADALRLGRPTMFAVATDGRGYAATGWPLVAAPSGVLVSESRPISFYPDGSSNGGTVFVTAGRGTLAVSVEPMTGGVGGA